MTDGKNAVVVCCLKNVCLESQPVLDDQNAHFLLNSKLFLFNFDGVAMATAIFLYFSLGRRVLFTTYNKGVARKKLRGGQILQLLM